MATTDPIRRTRAYLAACLPGVGMATEVPSDGKARLPFVVINANGGYEDDFLDLPSLLLDCHAATDVKAYDLARQVSALMRAMPDFDPLVSHVDAMSPYRNEWARQTTPFTPCYSVPCDMTINK